MALFLNRVPGFGREDRASGLRALLKADSIIVRLVIFIILGGIFYLVVQSTNDGQRIHVGVQGQQPQSAPSGAIPTK